MHSRFQLLGLSPSGCALRLHSALPVKTVALFLSLVCAYAARGACPAVTFEPRIDHMPGGAGPFIGSTTDVNVDGLSDVSLFYNDSTGFQTFLSNEQGWLTARPVNPTSGISTLEVADIEGDGLPDAAAGSGFDLRLFQGNGDGTYGFRRDIAMGAAPTDVRVADLNGDGRRDLVVVMAITARVVVLTQTVPWTFTAGPQMPIGGFEPHDPHVVDLDADGKLDVILVNSANTVDILYGRGDGTFDPVVKITLPASTAGGASLVVGDFNYDGRPDFAAGQIQNGAAIYVNDGGRSFHFDRRVAGADVVTPGAGARDMELADMNADGLADLIISTYGGFYTLLARPGGFFDPPVFHAVPELSSFGGVDALRFEVGDFRGDGRSDLAATIHHPSTTRFVTYPNACVPAPTVTSLAPGSGPAEGGTVVTIAGQSLLTTTQVLFGSTPGTILDTTGTSVTVRTPASAPSIVDVTVTTGGGSATLTGAFRFMGATTTTVTTEPAVVIVGEPFQLVATVAPALSGGSVTFTEGSTVLGTAPVVNGRASIALTSSTLDSRTIDASFSGTPIYFPNSGSATFRAFLPVAMTLQTSRAPSFDQQPYRVTATLDPAFTGGTVTFTVNGNVAGVVPVTNGTASIDLVVMQPGPQEIVATFSGFGDYAPETAVLSFQVGVAIPTLSELALLALAMMVAAVAAMKLRS